MKKRIVNALLAGFLLVSATACGKQPAADAAQPQADPTQAYLDTVDVDYAYDLALKLEDIRSNETLGYRTAGSDAELATGDMLKAEMERIGLQNVTKDAFTLDTQDSLFGLSRRCIPSWVSRAHPSLPSRKIYHFIDSLSAHGFRRGRCLFIPSAGSIERPRRNRPWDSGEHRPAGPQNEGADRWTFPCCPQRQSASPPLQDRPRSHPPCCTRRTVW